MNDFKPSDNYDSLLRQAKSLYRLSKSLQAENAYYKKQINNMSAEEVIRLRAELESERQMNHELTKELEKQ